MFEMEMKIALILSLIFGIVFFRLSFYWSRMEYEERRINFISASLVTLFYSFLFFLVSFGILVLISFIWQYLPNFIKMFQP